MLHAMWLGEITVRHRHVRTLLWALRNESFSLKAACEELETEHQKIDHTSTGTVILEEIEYARNDVPCTVDVLNAAKQEFDLHPIAPGPDRMFSPASVAKCYLEELGISYPSEKVKDEGLNNKAKVTMRRSYGFRTFRILELALYHSLGKLPEPELTHDFSDES